MRERRRFPRYEAALEVRYSTSGNASIESHTVSRNISRVGIRIPVTRIIKKGDLVNLAIDPNDQKGPVSAVGKVVWTKKLDRPAILEQDAGVAFIKLDPNDAERIFQAVY